MLIGFFDKWEYKQEKNTTERLPIKVLTTVSIMLKSKINNNIDINKVTVTSPKTNIIYVTIEKIKLVTEFSLKINLNIKNKINKVPIILAILSNVKELIITKDLVVLLLIL